METGRRTGAVQAGAASLADVPTSPPPASGPGDGAAVTAHRHRALPASPAVGAWSWTVEGLAAVAGVTCADQLDNALGLGDGTALAGAAVVSALVAHRSADRCRGRLHGLTVVALGAAGALLTDDLTQGAGLPLVAVAPALVVALVVAFATWVTGAGAWSPRAVPAVSRSLLWCSVVLLASAVGTAGSDLLHEGVGLGEWSTALLVAVVIAAVVTTRIGLAVDALLCAWGAFVLIRPLGAAVADGLSRAPGAGGLGLGTARTSAVLLGLVLLVATLQASTLRRASAPAPGSSVVDLTAGPEAAQAPPHRWVSGAAPAPARPPTRSVGR